MVAIFKNLKLEGHCKISIFAKMENPKPKKDWNNEMLPGMREYKGVIMQDNDIEDIEVMDTYVDDIWVCSFPRSGTTLTQEMVYLIKTLDFNTATSVQLDDRFPLIDYRNEHFHYYRGLKYVESLKSPRMIKCHLHYHLLPEQLRKGKGKIIYIARNPKDVVLSFYRLIGWVGNHLKLNFEEFCEAFIHGRLNACPWTTHVLGYWNQRDKNMLFLKYEDVVKDKVGTIGRISDFLECDLTEDDVVKICEHCDIDNMRSNDKVNWSWFREYIQPDETQGFGFINKGEPGAWKEHLSAEASAQIDKMIEEHQSMKGIAEHCIIHTSRNCKADNSRRREVELLFALKRAFEVWSHFNIRRQSYAPDKNGSNEISQKEITPDRHEAESSRAQN